MPRIRSIKPEHWDDKNLPKISLGAHLMWISMWNFSDDKGVIENDCYLIKSNSFPRRKEIKPFQIKKWIEELIKYNFVIPFEYNEIQYLIHRTFDVHQKIDKPQKSKIEENIINEIRRSFAERSTNGPRTFADDSDSIRRKDRIGEERIGLGEEKDRIGGDVLEKFSLSKIYNKEYNELNGSFKDLTEKGFLTWKRFVDLIIQKRYEEIFNCKFVNPQDFEKLDFPESKWEETIKLLLSTGIKPEHNLFFRIPQFLKYGLDKSKGGTSSNRSGISGTSIIPADKKYRGGL